MAFELPDTMRALMLDAYLGDLAAAAASLRVTRLPLPRPQRGQVLVRIEAAPCNPSDELLLRGAYVVRKPLPTVPGWEGAGTVVASGGGLFARWLRGRRVACSGQSAVHGTWAEYFLAEALQCIPLHNDVSFDQGASLIVNPLTALALLRSAQRGRHAAAVQTAAASQLGRMLMAMARAEGYPLVNIVRRPEQVELLRAEGAEHVLNSESPDFDAALAEKCRALRATAGFDAVAGAMTGRLLAAMPPRAVVYVYGELSHEPCGGISPIGLLADEKRVEGFYLSHWVRRAGKLGVLRAARQVQRWIAAGTIQTHLWRRVGLDDASAAILDHQHDATRGKLLIVPQLAATTAPATQPV